VVLCYLMLASVGPISALCSTDLAPMLTLCWPDLAPSWPYVGLSWHYPAPIFDLSCYVDPMLA